MSSIRLTGMNLTGHVHAFGLSLRTNKLVPGYLKQADVIMDLDLDLDRAQPAHASPKRRQSFHNPAL